MNYFTMFRRRFYLILLLVSCVYATNAQDVNVDVNLNIKHSVNGASEFNRENYMTLHATAFETDWDGEEDKLDYLLNDLDTYFGRDNGSATWKFSATEEDPNRPNWPSVDHMVELGTWLRGEYDKDFNSHQFEARSKEMIMGTNPHPTYPTLSWNGDGNTWTGWQPYDVDVSAEWVVNYLDYFFRKADGSPGEPLPYYWEVINEPDMPMMTGHMTCTSQEKIWEYHNLVALGIRERFGVNNPNRPKVGGMTWGLHDFHLADGISRYDENYLDQYLDGEGLITYHNMMDSEANNYRTTPWYQWDVMWQGFMDTCGENMDFYSIHIYDWPGWDLNGDDKPSATRAGGHTEAMLDILEWYDLYKTGTRKEMIVSEFGAVNGGYNTQNTPGRFDSKRIDWECLKPFNSMFMQFLERPDYITKSMPFTPTKAIWGDTPDQNLRYPYAMMQPDANGVWQWSEYIKFFELWSNVKGTRIETKASNPDVQVNAYADGNKLYLILNNLEDNEKTINLAMYDDFANPVQNVMIKNLYLDMNKGTAGQPALDVINVKTAPGSVKLLNDATMVLEYTFANPVNLSETLNETKFMGDKIGDGFHPFGSELIHKNSTSLTTQVNNVVVPSGAYEATLRVSGAFFKAHLSSVKVTINGVEIQHDGNWRGAMEDLRNQWLGVLELDIPAGLLQANNTIECQSNAPVDWATTQIQVFDFSKEPGRSGVNTVALTSVSLSGDQELMQGKETSLATTFAPENATNKALTWLSSNPSVATVDEFGVITAVATSGSTTITATSADGSVSASHTINAIPFSATPVASVTINEGASVDAEFYVYTPLTVTITPEDATDQEVVWSSSNPDAVAVNASTGKIQGLVIGESAVITATVGGKSTSTTVNVGIVGDEEIYCDALPSEVTGNTNYTFDVSVNLLGSREVKVELLSGATVLGSGSTVADVKGKEFISVDLALSNVPSIGNYTLRVTALNGGQTVAQCTRTLSILDRIRPSSITLVDWLREVEVGQTLPIAAEVLPADAYDKTVLWTSSNPAVASVSADGTITGAALGSTVIRGTLQDGGLYQEVTVQVKNQVVVQPTSIQIPSDITVFPGGNFQVTPIFVPEWTTEKNINWSIDGSIASVDANGVITATTTQGTVTLTATSSTSPAVSTTSAVTIGTTLTVEAESFSAMGGAVGEIGIYDLASASKGQAINNVQAGDFVEFEVFVPQAGQYRATFFAGTGLEDGVIEMYVNGSSQGSKQVPMNDWDAFAAVTLDQDVTLPQGTVTIGLVASGTSDWQWNMDYFQLAYQGGDCGAVTGITINASSTTITIGNTSTLGANLQTVGGAIPCDNSVVWTSSNTNVATVNNSGQVTGVAAGNVTITATASGFTATQNLTVQEVLVTGVVVSPSDVQLNVGGSQQLTATVAPANATNKSVVWSSSNPSVATVSSTGLVSAVTNGSAVISATTVSGTFVASSDVTVSTVINDVTGVSLNTTSLNLVEGNSTQLVETVLPANASNKSVTWSTSNALVATVANGFVTGVSEGMATITVATVDGNYQATATVNVTKAGEGNPLVIEAEDFVATGGNYNDGFVPFGANKVDGLGINYVNSGDYVEYTVTGNGVYGVDYYISTPMTNAAIEIQLDGQSIGSDNVPNNGEWDNYTLLTSAHQLTLSGTHTIRLVASGSNAWQWNLDKIVLNPVSGGGDVNVTGVTLSATSLTLDPSQTASLVASVLPANATNQSVTWSSDNTSVATVDDNGLVSAVSAGTATITVSTVDGNYQASASVTVNGGSATLVIEAEDFVSTGGTYNDGFVPFGVNKVNDLGINWVNSGDYAEYTVNIATAGVYDINYMISTPTDNAQIQVLVDGNVVTTDNVPNNGQWDAYTSLMASNTVNLSVGTHTVRFVASGSNAWQWNLDKVILSTGSSSSRQIGQELVGSKMNIYPNPSSEVINLGGIANGTYMVALYNVNGQEIYNTKIDFRYSHQFNVSKLPAGIYLIRIVGEGVDLKQRISVKK
ncbi:carbohydrate-binding protein [Flammeovirga sp. MY04]|uniref:Ig-like domain-containing protein n=1 Tax=Flammeovirga sp. MY04 TaxID=1191459 RepID=UPI000A04A3BF|nr:Ig-like domain-containing protein [Flammeovirga sp. MY04]ANQ52856.2 carbohydrate-binding protein [Flammeovirga sp. MY04]